MERVPCVVIGAGAVGLAIGRAISRSGIYTMVLEQHSTFGSENSSRNSEVLHAGLYYPVGSAKARFCNEGKLTLLRYLTERGIDHNQCGKLVIASSAAEIPTLHKIYNNGTANGLHDLRMISVDEARALEPSVSCVAAMISPFTGIFDSHNLMLNFITDIEDKGSDVVYNCEVQSVSKKHVDVSNNTTGTTSESFFEVNTTQGDIQCQYLINCAGMSAPLMAHRMDFYPRSAVPPTYFAKGNYFKLQGVSAQDTPFRRLIYPIPQAGGLGVHATLDLHGNVKFGPNVEWLPYRTPTHSNSQNGGGGGGGGDKSSRNSDNGSCGIYGEDIYRHPPGAKPPSDFTVHVRPASGIGASGAGTGREDAHSSETAIEEVFFREISKYWPGVRRDMLVPDYAGIRPKLCGPPPPPRISSVSADSPVPPSAASSPGAATPAPAVKTTTATSSSGGSATSGNSSSGGGGGGSAYEMPASADFAILGEASHGVPNLVCLFGIESPGLTSSLAIADHVRDILLESSRQQR